MVYVNRNQTDNIDDNDMGSLKATKIGHRERKPEKKVETPIDEN